MSKDNAAAVLTHVYVASFPFETDGGVVCAERAREIADCADERTRQSKFYVWKLLEYALKSSFGSDADNVTFRKTADGKWTCGKCVFSLSHKDSLAAVAVSSLPVGVDIEKITPERFDGKLQARILTENERSELSRLTPSERSLCANILWAEKEAAFKRGGNGCFVANTVETSANRTVLRKIRYGGSDYVLAVACGGAEEPTFYVRGVEICDL